MNDGLDTVIRENRRTLNAYGAALAGRAAIGEQAVKCTIVQFYEDYLRSGRPGPQGSDPIEWIKVSIARWVFSGSWLTLRSRRQRDHVIAVLHWGYDLDCERIAEILDRTAAEVHASAARTASRYRRRPKATQQETLANISEYLMPVKDAVQ